MVLVFLAGPPASPYGLEYLAQLDHLFVRQQVEYMEGKTHRKLDVWKMRHTESAI